MSESFQLAGSDAGSAGALAMFAGHLGAEYRELRMPA
jgi:hypothetical protein